MRIYPSFGNCRCDASLDNQFPDLLLGGLYPNALRCLVYGKVSSVYTDRTDEIGAFGWYTGKLDLTTLDICSRVV